MVDAMKGDRRKRRRSPSSVGESLPTSEPDVRRYHVDTFFYSCVAIASIVAMGAMVDNKLFNDDFRWLTAAREDMTWRNVWTYRVIGFFRPFINLTFWITEKTTPGNLLLYNVTQIVLHVTNTVLLFHLFRRVFTDRTLAAATAFLFLVTYNHFGAIIWISGRTTLIMALFLLSAFLAALTPTTRLRRWTAWALYGLALASKEEAIVGPILLWLLYWYRRRQESPEKEVPPSGSVRLSFERSTLVGFCIVAAVYLAVRTAAIGHVTQGNWGPGLQAIGNLAASFLGQFWPTLLFALTNQSLMAHPSDSVFWPELLALPMIAGLLVVGWRIQRLRAMSFALLWMATSILPMIFLKFRFVSMGSAIHTRYYYMPCMGSCLAIVLVLVALWRARKHARIMRVAAAVLFAAICFVEIQRTRNFEHRFSRGNAGMDAMATEVITMLDNHPEIIRLVIGEVPYPRNYLMMLVHLERPLIEIQATDGGLEAAGELSPCVYLSRSRQDPGQFSLLVLR